MTNHPSADGWQPAGLGKNRYKYAGAAISFVLLMGLLFVNTREHKKPGPVRSVSAAAIHLTGGWGYEIKVNHRLYIYQSQVPCLTGKQLFPTRQSAMAIAELVKEKIMQGRSPSISRKELAKALPLPH